MNINFPICQIPYPCPLLIYPAWSLQAFKLGNANERVPKYHQFHDLLNRFYTHPHIELYTHTKNYSAKMVEIRSALKCNLTFLWYLNRLKSPRNA